MKIAIIDDSSFSRRQIKRVFAEELTEVLFIEFSNGTDAVDKLEHANVDLITLDLVMPEPNGLEVLKQLREKKVQAPIYIVSADIQDSTKQACADAGCTGFFEKPLVGSAIKSIIS
jgi:twitching motility two-component system response regulator PilH